MNGVKEKENETDLEERGEARSGAGQAQKGKAKGGSGWSALVNLLDVQPKPPLPESLLTIKNGCQ
jgi:hypothetical protein